MLIISSSLNSKSKSFLLAQEAQTYFSAANIDYDFLDLREYDLPLCDAGACYGNPAVSLLQEKIATSKGIVCCAPIYNYDVNSALKTLLECTGKSWENKVVSMMVTAGGFGSYMSPVSFINSLMLDFRCLVLPDFVYSTEADFENSKIINIDLPKRISYLLSRQAKLADFYISLNH